MALEPTVVVFAEPGDGHARALQTAFRRQGASAVAVDLADCSFAVGSTPSGLAIPGFASGLPGGVLVRTVGRASFEQVTLRLSLLHALADLGVVVSNQARAIERCVDKSLCSFLLARAGLPTPATWVTEDPYRAEAVVAAASGDLVLKPLFGSRGRGLQRLPPRGSLPQDPEGGVWYLQKFVGAESDWHDTRAFVVGHRVIAAMTRWGQGWVTNRHQGARCEATPVTPDLAALAVAAAEAVGADHAGVDLIRDRDGAWQILEVNSMPAWSGLQSVAPVSIADALAADLLARIDRRGRG